MILLQHMKCRYLAGGCPWIRSSTLPPQPHISRDFCHLLDSDASQGNCGFGMFMKALEDGD